MIGRATYKVGLPLAVEGSASSHWKGVRFNIFNEGLIWPSRSLTQSNPIQTLDLLASKFCLGQLLYKQWKVRSGCLEKFALGNFRGSSDDPREGKSDDPRDFPLFFRLMD